MRVGGGRRKLTRDNTFKGGKEKKGMGLEGKGGSGKDNFKMKKLQCVCRKGPAEREKLMLQQRSREMFLEPSAPKGEG